MSKEIKFSLLYRDMWQSSGKYVPRVDQLVKVAPAIVKMGCFARVETNGGGFEQINLLFGENPNQAVRQWTKPFHDAGIQTHMLDRALNGLRMSPVPADVRKLFYKVKMAQGTDIARTFCGLNDPRNLIPSIHYAKAAGMISQAALSITVSPLHTVEYYTRLAFQLIEEGADEICLKDMAGIGRPVSLGQITRNIKEKYPHIPIQYHSHAGPGLSVASILEVCKAGADYIDVGMEPLSWGTGHADLLTVHAMLQDAGFKVPDINMEAYMEVRALTQEFIDDFLGFYISPENRLMNSLLIGSGLPGGMMGSLMADLESNLDSINKYLAKQNQPPKTRDQLLILLFDEVAYVWPRVGYPPLVTPFSQYVKNLALMNVVQLLKGKDRWSTIADDIWDMILGKAGKIPGEIAPEILALAKKEGRVFENDNPQDHYPDQLDHFRAEMKKKGWETGTDDEELFEYAMHPAQYEAYKSGKAKAEFEADIAARRAKANKAPETAVQSAFTAELPQTVVAEVNGQRYRVFLTSDTPGQSSTQPVSLASATTSAASKTIVSPLEGKFFLTKNSAETPLKVGDRVNIGDRIGYIEAMKTFNAVSSDVEGEVVAIAVSNGDAVEEDDILISLA